MVSYSVWSATGGDGDGGAVQVRVPEDGVQAHATAAAPPPRSDLGRIDERPPLQQLVDRRGLLGRGHDADLAMDGLPPLAAAGHVRAAVVHAGDDEPVLREHPVPQPAGAGPGVPHRLAVRLAVDVHEQRQFRGRIDFRRLHAPPVQCDTVADRHLHERDLRPLQGGYFLPQFGVVGQRADGGQVAQPHQVHHRRRGEVRPGCEPPTSRPGRCRTRASRLASPGSALRFCCHPASPGTGTAGWRSSARPRSKATRRPRPRLQRTSRRTRPS